MLEPTMITSQIQGVQNYCSEKQCNFQNFIVKEKLQSILVCFEMVTRKRWTTFIADITDVWSGEWKPW